MTKDAFPKRPDLKEIERKWQERWEEMKLYRFDPESKAEIYSIDVPPRYVSGPLHIGHAVSYTHIDFVARYKRMQGYNVFNPLCFDVNGLPIEVNVEKKGIHPEDVGRAEFVRHCETFGEANIETMIAQFKRLGHSFDPSIYYQTNKPYYRRITQLTFLEMFKQGHIYRGEHPVNFCPRCRTALSDAEIEYGERKSKLNHVKFYLTDSSGLSEPTVKKDENGTYVTIATSRPELLSACQLVAVHPDDESRRALVGRKVIVPLYGREVEILADESVDPEFGTGVVMICTFGDKDDLEWSKRYKLEFIRAIEETGAMGKASGKYAGMSIEEAKTAVIQDLRAAGLLLEQEPLEQRVGFCWRCHTPVEYIATTQWFFRVLPEKDTVLDADRKIAWFPEHMRQRLVNWVEALDWDWCISRQRYFATPIPIWTCEACAEVVLAEPGQLYVDPTQDPPPLDACPKCGGPLKGSEEVFDTWFDSSITPIYNTFWGRDDALHRRLYPMSLRPQSHDIIRTWAYYTILRDTLLTGEAPFRNIAISGFILGPDGRPMHSSWGNVVDPLEVTEELGTEALRYFAARCGLGVDTAFNWENAKHGVSLSTKLWNICRFVRSQIEDFDPSPGEPEYSPYDRWMLTSLSRLIADVTSNFDNHEFDKGMLLVEDFMWHKLADNYLEIVKHRLYKGGEGSRRAAQDVLRRAIEAVLKMLAPLLPHITEELYQLVLVVGEEIESIHATVWPDLVFEDEASFAAGERGLEVISAGRKWKQDHRMALGAEVETLTVRTKADESLLLAKDEIAGTLRVGELRFEEGDGLEIVG
jgi:valyl-tRNA synthetase